YAYNLAQILVNHRKYAEAEEHFRRSFTGWENVLGVSHDDTLTTLERLVVVLRRQRKFGEAEDFIRLFKERGGIYTDDYIEVDDSETDWGEVDDSEMDLSEVGDSPSESTNRSTSFDPRRHDIRPDAMQTISGSLVANVVLRSAKEYTHE
ncbi:hypothetical protein BDD12DRAFT_810289, partial [Trichophaea hybrida]